MKKCVVSLLLLNLFACGGSSTSPITPVEPAPVVPITSNPAGIWHGKVNEVNDLSLVITDNVLRLIAYESAPSDLPDVYAEGEYTVKGDTLTVETLKYTDFASATASASLSLTIKETESVSGTIDLGGLGTLSFDAQYSVASTGTPDVSSLLGRARGFSGTEDTNRASFIDIASDGAFSMTVQTGCVATGLLAASSNGNYYETSLSLDAQTCSLDTDISYSGITFIDPEYGVGFFNMMLDSEDGSKSILWWGESPKSSFSDDFTTTPRLAEGTALSNAEGMWTGLGPDSGEFFASVNDMGELFITKLNAEATTFENVVFAQLENTAEGATSSNGYNHSLDGLDTKEVSIIATNGASADIMLVDVTDADNVTISLELSYDDLYDSEDNITTVADLSGSFMLQSRGIYGALQLSVDFNNNGGFFGTADNGCNYSGIVKKRARGNIFDLSLYVDEETCQSESNSFAGTLFYNKNVGRGTGILSGTNKKSGLAFVIGRPQ